MNEKPSSAEKPDSRWSDDSAFVTESYESDSRLQYEPTVGMSNMGGRLAPPQREAAAVPPQPAREKKPRSVWNTVFAVLIGVLGVLALLIALLYTALLSRRAPLKNPWAAVLTYANALLCLLCFLLRRRLPTAVRIIVMVLSGHLLLLTLLLSSVR